MTKKTTAEQAVQALEALQGIPAATPKAVTVARKSAGLTQAQAAELVGLGDKARWAEYERGARAPDAPRWALFLLATGQHPKFRLTAR